MRTIGETPALDTPATISCMSASPMLPRIMPSVPVAQPLAEIEVGSGENHGRDGVPLNGFLVGSWDRQTVLTIDNDGLD